MEILECIVDNQISKILIQLMNCNKYFISILYLDAFTFNIVNFAEQCNIKESIPLVHRLEDMV